MDHTTLNDATTIPMLGLGVYLVSDVRLCERTVASALRGGYRLLDTAAMYGNERAVGRGIRASGVARDEIFLTSKVWVSDFGYEKTKASIAASLQRLDTDYLDLMLLHQPAGDYVGSWKALEEAVGEGKLRSIGVSNFTVDDLNSLLPTARIVPSVNQVELHPLFQQAELVPFLREHGIAPEAWFPLGHGSRRLLEDPVFTDLAARYGKSPAQVILRWHVQYGVIAIPKSTNPEHVAANLDIFDFELTDEEMERIRSLDRGHPTFRVPRWVMRAATGLMRPRQLP